MWMQELFYLEQRSKELLPVENNPTIKLVKETGLRPDEKTVKTWLWVAYGMVDVKLVKCTYQSFKLGSKSRGC